MRWYVLSLVSGEQITVATAATLTVYPPSVRSALTAH